MLFYSDTQWGGKGSGGGVVLNPSYNNLVALNYSRL